MVPNLLALFLLAQSQSARPITELPSGEVVIASDSSCPSADAVRQALAGLRPATERPAAVVVIRAGEQSLSIDLGSRGTRQRQLAIGPDCPARAMSAALVIATWLNDLPAEMTDAPILHAPEVMTPSPPPRPSPLPRRSAYQEIGAAVSTAVPGDWAPGGNAEFIRMWAERGLGLLASVGLRAPRNVWVGNGVTRWMRSTASVALHARQASQRAFVAADLGLGVAYTAAWGTGYAETKSAHSTTWGPVAGARAGIPWGHFRLWTDLRVKRFFPSESVQVNSTSSTTSTSAALPSWEGQWSLGVSYALP